MRIIQSLWSKPSLITGGWSEKTFYNMSWALSCLKLKEFYKSVELYTDREGKNFLIDKLQLPYDKVYVVLDNLNEFSPRLWALGKVYTYSLQNQPFIHVDGDVYIWKKFQDRIEKAQLIVQHKEENYEHNLRSAQKLINDGFNFKKELDPMNDAEITEVNAGIIGGNNIDFFQRYTKEVFDFIVNNKKQIERLKDKDSGHINTIFEQYFFYKLSLKYNIKIEYLFTQKIDSTFLELVSFASIPHMKSYIHTVGYHKKNYAIGERVAHRLWYEYPSYYNRILKLIEK